MRFLVESAFDRQPTPEMLALLPAESARGAELDAQGVREALYVAADNSRAWQILRAESRDELDGIMASFPLYAYLTTTVTPIVDGAASP